MATPKIDAIIQEFANRIGEPVTFVASVLQDGANLTAVEYMTYINKSMFKLINDMWMQSKGDIQKFLGIFPELVSQPKTIVLTAGNYIFANPNLDFMKLVSCYLSSDNTHIRILPETYYGKMREGGIPQLAATSTYPAVIQLNNLLAFFPVGSTYGVTILYIMQPLNPTDGTFLTQNGTYDSPFFNTWNSKIAEIAETFYKIDVQEN